MKLCALLTLLILWQPVVSAPEEIQMFVALKDGNSLEMTIERPACEHLNEALSEGAEIKLIIKETGQIGEVIMVLCHGPGDRE